MSFSWSGVSFPGRQRPRGVSSRGTRSGTSTRRGRNRSNMADGPSSLSILHKISFRLTAIDPKKDPILGRGSQATACLLVIKVLANTSRARR